MREHEGGLRSLLRYSHRAFVWELPPQPSDSIFPCCGDIPPPPIEVSEAPTEPGAGFLPGARKRGALLGRTSLVGEPKALVYGHCPGYVSQQIPTRRAPDPSRVFRLHPNCFGVSVFAVAPVEGSTRRPPSRSRPGLHRSAKPFFCAPQRARPRLAKQFTRKRRTAWPSSGWLGNRGGARARVGRNLEQRLERSTPSVPNFGTHFETRSQ